MGSAKRSEPVPEALSRKGDDILRPAAGTLKRRGRPRAASPKRLVSLRLDVEVLEHFRASGPGWQRRLNDALKKSIGT
jgi:uncharacterized protein (DUF4415 family)